VIMWPAVVGAAGLQGGLFCKQRLVIKLSADNSIGETNSIVLLLSQAVTQMIKKSAPHSALGISLEAKNRMA